MANAFDGDSDQGESYFISFSDLLIGMIFLFIIVLLGYALSFRSAEMRADAELSRLQEERDQLELEKAELEKRAKSIESVAQDLIEREKWRDQMLQEMAQGLADRGVDVALDLEKGVLRLPETLLFASGSAELTDRGEGALQDLAIVMGRVVPCYVEASPEPCLGKKRSILETVLIEGHTDNVPITNSEFRDNWDLSVARGVNTYKALTRAGEGETIGLDGLRNGQNEAILGVSGYETRRPVGSNSSAQDRERNRRIDLRFLIAAPKVEALQGVGISIDGTATGDTQ